MKTLKNPANLTRFKIGKFRVVSNFRYGPKKAVYDVEEKIKNVWTKVHNNFVKCKDARNEARSLQAKQ